MSIRSSLKEIRIEVNYIILDIGFHPLISGIPAKSTSSADLEKCQMVFNPGMLILLSFGKGENVSASDHLRTGSATRLYRLTSSILTGEPLSLCSTTDTTWSMPARCKSCSYCTIGFTVGNVGLKRKGESR